MEEKKNPENKCAKLMKKVFKIKYDKDALNIMFNMQYELQKFYGEKRKSVTPDSENKERIKESLYHFNCFIAEIWEFQERLNDNIKTEEEFEELGFEIVDAWHFLMNMFLYLGIRSFDEDLEFYWKYDDCEGNYMETITKIIFDWGKILDELPYKYWKTYENYNFNEKKVRKIGENILKLFFVLCKSFDISREMFFGMYIAKNKENYDRQKRGY
jgi:soluble cytochrome b562